VDAGLKPTALGLAGRWGPPNGRWDGNEREEWAMVGEERASILFANWSDAE